MAALAPLFWQTKYIATKSRPRHFGTYGIPGDFCLNGTVIRFDESVLPEMEPRLFEPAWLRENQLWQGSTPGRNEAHFFHYAERDMVLRYFCRGGLMGRMNRDLCLRGGAARSRAVREFDLLSDMYATGCLCHCQSLQNTPPSARSIVPMSSRSLSPMPARFRRLWRAGRSPYRVGSRSGRMCATYMITGFSIPI